MPENHLDWIKKSPHPEAAALSEAIGATPLIGAVLTARGIKTTAEARAFLDPSTYQPSPSSELPDIEKAADRIGKALRDGESIWVWGDFDVDGQTATALLVEGLQQLGGHVQYYIPNREMESHGIHPGALESLINRGAQLIITCDTGVREHRSVSMAAERGVDVVITDHHDLPATLPDAVAVVNPKRCPQGHPLRDLPGVGAAYKTMEHIYKQLGRGDELVGFLDLVALGIVADLALLRADSRYLLQLGIQHIQRQPRLGIKALAELTKTSLEAIQEETIGFVFAPRLNALGRLAQADPAVDLLLTDDPQEAQEITYQLERYNDRRKLITNQILQSILERVERSQEIVERGSIILSHPAWPTGLLGLAAGRLADHFHLPVILISKGPEGEWRGSARSVEGVDISKAIDDMADQLIRHGGHPMAAGFSLQEEKVEPFSEGLARLLQDSQREKPSAGKLEIDAYISFSELTLDFLEEVERLAPFGPGNPKLTYAHRGVRIIKERAIGSLGEHVEFTLSDSTGAQQRVIRWNGVGQPKPQSIFDIAFHARPSRYKGERRVEAQWVDYRLAVVEDRPIHVAQPRIELVDHRQSKNPLGDLLRLLEEANPQVWVEGDPPAGLQVRGRYQLVPSQGLAIWTIPCGSEELREVIKRVSPTEVFVFGVDPSANQPLKVVERIAGMAKFALRARDGWLNLEELAIGAAERVTGVRAIIRWLEARGEFKVVEERVEELRIETPGMPGMPNEVSAYSRGAKLALMETRSYREFFKEVSQQVLMQWFGY